MNTGTYKKIINTVSILIPVVVAGLFGVKVEGYDLTFLPKIYASVNGLTALVLITSLIVVKRGNTDLHRKLMVTAMALSALFLIMYVAYHMTSDSTTYGGEGGMAIFYYIILISHIILSILIVPLVLHTFLKALIGDFKAHKRWAKFAMPLWIYVAISGVIVYIMISPYYVTAI